MKTVEIQKNSTMRFSFEKEEEFIINNYKILAFQIESNIERKINKNVTLEITLPIHASSYALLGAEYLCDNSVSSLTV